MFWSFRQNNTGGDFHYNEALGLSVLVVVEADTWCEANERAENIGVYFDGCEYGLDCPCCGDRWYPQTIYDGGDAVPSRYGDDPLVEYDQSVHRGYLECTIPAFVHYRDGTIRSMAWNH